MDIVETCFENERTVTFRTEGGDIYGVRMDDVGFERGRPVNLAGATVCIPRQGRVSSTGQMGNTWDETNRRFAGGTINPDGTGTVEFAA